VSFQELEKKKDKNGSFLKVEGTDHINGRKESATLDE